MWLHERVSLVDIYSDGCRLIWFYAMIRSQNMKFLPRATPQHSLEVRIRNSFGLLEFSLQQYKNLLFGPKSMIQKNTFSTHSHYKNICLILFLDRSKKVLDSSIFLAEDLLFHAMIYLVDHLD